MSASPSAGPVAGGAVAGAREVTCLARRAPTRGEAAAVSVPDASPEMETHRS